MNRLSRVLSTLLLFALPAVAHADPVAITSGYFILDRPVAGTERASATMVWLDPPASIFGPNRPDLVKEAWQPSDTYSSTLLATTAPVQPLHPGPQPVGGSFTSSSLSLDISGGTFVVPSVFPPTDEDNLYILPQPFAMTGHWRVDVPLQNGQTFSFDRDFAAQGTAQLVLSADRASGNSIVSQVIYSFDRTAPTPEPATVLLLGAGAAALIARRRNR